MHSIPSSDASGTFSIENGIFIPLDLWNSIPVAFVLAAFPLPCCEGSGAEQTRVRAERGEDGGTKEGDRGRGKEGARVRQSSLVGLDWG